MVGGTTSGVTMLRWTGMVTGLLPAALEMMVIAPRYDPTAIPLGLTETTRLDGVVPDAAETLSQLGCEVSVNGSGEVPETLMDWVAGVVPAGVVKVKLIGVIANVGLGE